MNEKRPYGETEVRDALNRAGLNFEQDARIPGTDRTLDFHVPHFDSYIEVKAYHTDRVNAQLASAENVILLQGKQAIDAFCHLLGQYSKYGRA